MKMNAACTDKTKICFISDRPSCRNSYNTWTWAVVNWLMNKETDFTLRPYKCWIVGGAANVRPRLRSVAHLIGQWWMKMEQWRNDDCLREVAHTLVRLIIRSGDCSIEWICARPTFGWEASLQLQFSEDPWGAKWLSSRLKKKKSTMFVFFSGPLTSTSHMFWHRTAVDVSSSFQSSADVIKLENFCENKIYFNFSKEFPWTINTLINTFFTLRTSYCLLTVFEIFFL